MNKFSDYFDDVIILNLLSNKEKRKNMDWQMKELDQSVSNYRFHNSVIFPHNNVIMDSFNNRRNEYQFRKPNEIGCAMEHYRIVKESYESGKNSILVMEDDLRILKDFSVIDEYLKDIPSDYDILMMSSYIGITGVKDIDIVNHKDSRKINEHWFIPFWPGWCCAMIAMNRRGMKYILDEQEKLFRVADYPGYDIIAKQKKDINLYFSTTPLAIQADLFYTSDIRTRNEIEYKRQWNLYENRINDLDYFDLKN